MHNQASLARDHSRYTRNVEQVVAPLAVLAVELSGQRKDWFGEKGHERLLMAQRWRMRRVRLRGVALLIHGIAASAAVFWVLRSERNLNLTDWAAPAVGLVSEKAENWLRDLSEWSGTEVLSAAILAVVALLIWQWLAAGLWYAWSQRAARDLVSRSPVRVSASMLGFLTFEAATAAIGATLIGLARSPLGTSPFWKATLLLFGIQAAMLIWFGLSTGLLPSQAVVASDLQVADPTTAHQQTDISDRST